MTRAEAKLAVRKVGAANDTETEMANLAIASGEA